MEALPCTMRPCTGTHQWLVEVLLARGAATEFFDKDGFLPLHLAALSGKPDVTALRGHGAKVSALTRDTKESALKLEAVRVLLESGADRRAKDSKGRTPLDRAAEGNFSEIVVLLRVAK